MARKKEFKIDKDDIAYEEEVEECGFTDYIPSNENSIQLFSMEDDLAHENKNIDNNNLIIETKEEVNKKMEQKTNSINNNFKNNNSISSNPLLFDNRNTPIANGAAPPIDGESANIKRSYTLRNSTVRKINELKSIHPDINVCVSTIVDIAIDYYHTHIVNNNMD
ncbi:hypothetical protein FDC58_03765 [Clostridium botulinum]|nr:hypothetical protein [Clostridium botulinum]NFP28414.1 hypothetical protein [Clostridium botulinum]